jgi:hypothetical protein
VVIGSARRAKVSHDDRGDVMQRIVNRTIGLVIAGVVALTGTIALAAPGQSEQGSGRVCSDVTLKGTYGGNISGTRPWPPPAGPLESITGVVIRTYDGEGQFTQIDNIKGTTSGIVPDRPGYGTYHVNEDCSGVTEFVPGPGILLRERIVIVDDGNEVRTIVESPLFISVSGSAKRIHAR